MSLIKTLEALDELQCRVGENGLYIRDGAITMLITNWREDPFWSKIGASVLKYQDVTQGVSLASLLQGDERHLLMDAFPGLGNLDLSLRDNYREGRVDLMPQFRRGLVSIKVTPGPDYIVFNSDGQEVFIQAEHVYLLEELGAKLMACTGMEENLSFSANPGIVGFFPKMEPEIEPRDAAFEDIEECKQRLDEFEAIYSRFRRSHSISNEEETCAQIREEFLECLHRISGYERHGDSEFNRRVESLIEELWSDVIFTKGICFPIKGTEYFETTHPERMQHIETDGTKWYVFVSSWDNGYTDGLGTHLPITDEIAQYLRKRVPDLPVRR